MRRDLALGLARNRGLHALGAALGRDQLIVVAGRDAAHEDQHHADVRQREARDHQRVVPQRVELRVREAEDDGQDGAADVAQQHGEEGGYAPVATAAYNDVEVAAELVTLIESRMLVIMSPNEWGVGGIAYGVESQEPEFARDLGPSKEPRNRHTGRQFRRSQHHRDDTATNVEPDTRRGAEFGVACSVRDRDTDDLPTDVAEVINQKGRQTRLGDNVLPTVDGGGADDLGPDDEDESDVVDPAVDAVEQVVAKLGAVGQTHEERHDGQEGHDDGARVFDARVDEQRGRGVEHDEGGAEAQHHEREEQQDGPKVGAGHLDHGFRQRQEAHDESAKTLAFLGPAAKEAHDAKHGKGREVFEEHVAAADEDSIHDSVRVLGVIRGIRGKVAKPDARRKEDLAHGRLPHGTIGQLLGPPCGPKQLDTLACVVERQGPAHENDGGADGQAHGEVDDAAREPHAAEDGHPNQEPDEDAPGHRLANQLRVGVLREGQDGSTIRREAAGNWVRVRHNVVVVEVVEAALPWQGARKGVTEIVHDPGQVHSEILDHDEAHKDGAEAHPFEPAMYVMEGDDGAAAVSLANGDLKNQRRNGDDENGQKVGDEPLQTIVVVHDRGVAQQVALAGAPAHGSQQEGSARGPLVAPVVR